MFWHYHCKVLESDIKTNKYLLKLPENVRNDKFYLPMYRSAAEFKGNCKAVKLFAKHMKVMLLFVSSAFSCELGRAGRGFSIALLPSSGPSGPDLGGGCRGCVPLPLRRPAAF